MFLNNRIIKNHQPSPGKHNTAGSKNKRSLASLSQPTESKYNNNEHYIVVFSKIKNNEIQLKKNALE